MDPPPLPGCGLSLKERKALREGPPTAARSALAGQLERRRTIRETVGQSAAAAEADREGLAEEASDVPRIAYIPAEREREKRKKVRPKGPIASRLSPLPPTCSSQSEVVGWSSAESTRAMCPDEVGKAKYAICVRSDTPNPFSRL